MTVSNQKRSIRYQGNDSATEFDYDFFIEEASHVEVIIYNSTTETYTTLTGGQYSITGLNDPAFGAVTYPLAGDPLSTDEYIIINRVAPYVQVMDIPPQGGFYPDVIEAALDRTTRQIQQIAEIQSRSLFVVEGETFQKRLPLRSLLVDRVLAFDENGDPIAGPTAAEIGNAQGYAEDASAAQTAAEAAQTAAEDAQAAAEAARDEAVDAASSVTSIQESEAYAEANYHPVAAPEFIQTAGNASAGDGGAALYKSNGTTSGDLVITLDDGITDAGFDIVFDAPFTVKSFGAVGDGVANDSAAFVSAHAAVPAGYPIVVPAGTYDLGTNIDVTGRQFVFHGDVVLQDGILTGAVIERRKADGSRSFGGGMNFADVGYWTKYRFGRTIGNLGITGLQIGGGEPNEGEDGTALYLDNYSGWAVMQNSKHPGPQELAVQPRPAAYEGIRYAGDDYIYTNPSSVPLFDAGMIGKRVYFGDETYLIYDVPATDRIRVTELNGTGVTWSSGASATVLVCYAGGTGFLRTNGTDVFRLSGDPFVPMTNTEYKIKINGTVYDVVAFASPDLVAISSDLGVQAGPIAYEWWTSVDNLSAALRVHRIASAGFEENVTLSAHASGYYRLQALGSGGEFPYRQYPFYLGNGYDTDGSQRVNILLDGVLGDTFIGGGYARSSLRVTHRQGITSNNVRISGAASSAPPEISSEGAATDVDLVVTAKGSGMVRIGGSISGHATTGTARSIFVKDYDGNIIRIAGYVP